MPIPCYLSQDILLMKKRVSIKDMRLFFLYNILYNINYSWVLFNIIAWYLAPSIPIYHS